MLIFYLLPLFYKLAQGYAQDSQETRNLANIGAGRTPLRDDQELFKSCYYCKEDSISYCVQLEKNKLEDNWEFFKSELSNFFYKNRCFF